MNDIDEVLKRLKEASVWHEDSNELYELIVNTTKFNHELMDLNIKYNEEIERLNNIINELEKYLIEYSQDLEFRYYANTFLDKLRELKGSDKE